MSDYYLDILKESHRDPEETQDLAFVEGTDQLYEYDYFNRISNINKSTAKIVLTNFSLTLIPEEVLEMYWLRVLLLGDKKDSYSNRNANNITKIPADIKNLKRLVKIDLSHNLLEEIPSEFGQLRSLKELRLSYCYLQKTPRPIFWLKKLTKLILDHNGLKGISTNIEKLANLSSIDLSNNQILTIPSELFNLKKLTNLNLSHNNITDLSSGVTKLKNLKILNISNNNLENLPPEIVNMDLKYLNIEGNPLKSPPLEIAKQGFKAIKLWFESVQNKDRTRTLLESKLILIGNSGVGKTTLRENLIDSSYKLTEHKSTHGLEVKKWVFEINHNNTIKKCYVNIWDFGGQGKYRLIQQFFCSSDSMYAFLTSPTDNYNPNSESYIGFSYWLSFINAFGYNRKNKTHSPVIHILNKIDIDGDKTINEKERKRAFSQITEFIKISCASGIGLDRLHGVIKKTITKLDNFGSEFNISWINVKQDLEEISSLHSGSDITNTNKKEFISYRKEYLPLCQQHGLSQEESDIWLNYLNSTGSILYFPHIDFLSDKIFLDPNWVRRVAYQVLDSELVLNNNGEFRKEDCRKIWIDQEGIDEIISLLKEFELCYETIDQNGKFYFIPTLFPNSAPFELSELEPEIEQFQNSVIVECSFTPFLPAGMLPRLIVRKNSQILKGLKWRRGVLLRNRETIAVISENWSAKKVQIKLHGANTEVLLNSIIEELQSIIENIKLHKNIGYLEIKTEVYCNCSECRTLMKAHSFSYPSILKRKQKGHEKISCNSGEDVFIDQVLSGRLHEKGNHIEEENHDTILFLGSNPKDLYGLINGSNSYTNPLRLGEEAKKIELAIKGRTSRKKYTFEYKLAVQFNELQNHILDYTPSMVHISGHSDKIGRFAFEDDLGNSKRVEASALGKLFSLSNSIKCVVINSCDSIIIGKEISKHIKYVICMNDEIPDNAAIAFSMGFYNGIASGRSIIDAFNYGCNSIQLQGLFGDLIPKLLISGENYE